MGARPTADGLDATHCHMTNSLNTPIEAMEHVYPVRITGYSVRRGSGGRGRFRGGDGIERRLQLLSESEVTILSDRRINQPYGLAGGEPGAAGENLLVHPDGREEKLPGKTSFRAPAGSSIVIRTPGGGGWGAP
jgi:N-methylhydantoinase B